MSLIQQRMVNDMKEETLGDRKIKKFPPPYKIDCTPYQKSDFSEFTYKKCCDDVEYNSENWLKICKIIIIGDVSVGKTCIVNRFCRKIFDTNYKSTIGVDFEVETFDILNVVFNLQIWDTAGQERFKCIAQSYYRGAHVILIVFDLTNPASLYHCQTWLKEALMSVSDPYIFLVGSKKDLLNRFSYKNMESSAMKLAKNINAEYWAVSSKTGKNINALFCRIAALAFDDYIKKTHELKQSRMEFGKSLVDLRSKNKPQNRQNCFVSKCK